MFFVFVQLQDRYELAVIPPMVDIKKKNATRFSPDSTNLKPVLKKMNKINNYLTTMNFHILTVTNRDSSTIYTPFPRPTAAQRRRACDFSHETQILIVHLLRLHF